jgi:hypothetical protein
MYLDINASFVTATPSGQGFRLFVDCILLESNWRFMDNKKILVSDKRSIMVVNLCHDGISYLNFWLSLIVLSLPVATSWCPVRKSEFEWNGVVSGIKRLIECKAILFKFKELLTKLNLDLFIVNLTVYILSLNIIPVTSLLFGFNINLQEVSLHLSSTSDVDLAINDVTFIVKGLICFDEEISSIKLTSGIKLVSHLKFLKIIYLFIIKIIYLSQL